MIWTVQNHFGQVIWPIFRVSLHFFFVAVLAFKSVFRHFSHLRPSLPYISVIRPLWIFRLEFWSKFFKNSETILWLAIRCISDRNFWLVGHKGLAAKVGNRNSDRNISSIMISLSYFLWLGSIHIRLQVFWGHFWLSYLPKNPTSYVNHSKENRCLVPRFHNMENQGCGLGWTVK